MQFKFLAEASCRNQVPQFTRLAYTQGSKLKGLFSTASVQPVFGAKKVAWYETLSFNIGLLTVCAVLFILVLFVEPVRLVVGWFRRRSRPSQPALAVLSLATVFGLYMQVFDGRGLASDQRSILTATGAMSILIVALTIAVAFIFFRYRMQKRIVKANFFKEGNAMKSQLPFLVPAIFVLTSLACSPNVPAIPKIETDATQTLRLNAFHSNPSTVMDVNMTMGIGELSLFGGAETLLEGDVRYNVQEWKPTVTNTGNLLTVTQGETDDAVQGYPGKDLVNVWNVRLGNIPLNLSLRAGGYDASLDLSGLPLRRLDIQDGVSESEIRFDSLNPEDMESLT